MVERTRLLNVLLLLIGALLSYALSQFDNSIYMKIELFISYKWLLICSLMIILILLFFLFSRPKQKIGNEHNKNLNLKLDNYYQDTKFGFLVNKKTEAKICTNCFYEDNNEIELTQLNNDKFKCPIKKCEQIYPVHYPTVRSIKR